MLCLCPENGGTWEGRKMQETGLAEDSLPTLCPGGAGPLSPTRGTGIRSPRLTHSAPGILQTRLEFGPDFAHNPWGQSIPVLPKEFPDRL